MSLPNTKVLRKTRREQEEDWTGTQLHAAGPLPMSSMNARKCVHECKKVCPWMQESVSMNARKCVHAQKPCPSQAFAHESSKVGGRGKKEEDRQESQRPGGWWKERQQKRKPKALWGFKTMSA